MDAKKFISAYKERRASAPNFSPVRGSQPLFCSSGVVDCLEAGGQWIADIVSSEICPRLKVGSPSLCVLSIKVEKHAEMTASISGKLGNIWSKFLYVTSLPEGVWSFHIFGSPDGKLFMTLPSESV
jgi:hypothetical protein